MKLYAVMDTKIGFSEKPFPMRNKAEALRGWIDVVNNKDSEFNKHPEDFTLLELGEWDSETATIKLHETKVSIASGVDVLKQVDPTKLSVAQ